MPLSSGNTPAPVPSELIDHDRWFCARVQEALDDPRPRIPHDEVEAHFARRRAAALRKADAGEA